MSVPVFYDGEKCGFLQNARQGLYTRFYGEVSIKDLSRVYAVYDGGELLLGVPVPEQGKMVLRTSMPTGQVPKGNLLRAELRVRPSGWATFPGGVIVGIRYPKGLKKGNILRFPWKLGEPLPTDEVLLFYRYSCVDGQQFLDISLDEIGNGVQGK